jgi:alpha-tubulin suppressor-like RCC1 family protein
MVLLAVASSTGNAGPPAGRVIGWGEGGGEKLDVATADSRRYVSVDGKQLTNVVAIAADHLHAMALRSDGTLVVWGWDPNKDLLTVPAGLNNVTAISLAADHNLALKADGRVVAWGYDTNAPWYDPTFVLPPGVSHVVAISGGGRTTLALKRDGTIDRWGPASGAIPHGLSNIVAIAENGSQGADDLALTSDGTVVSWRSLYTAINDAYPMPPGLTNVAAIATGYSHSLALKRDGTVAAWGFAHGGFMNPDYGQLNVPAGLSNVVAIAGGPAISLAVKKDGSVVVWGDNHHHQVDLAAGLSNIVAIAAGQDFCLAIQTNGILVETNIPPATVKP